MSEGVDGYLLYFGTNGLTDIINAGNNMTVTASNLVKGVEYEFGATAYGELGESPMSETILITP